MIIPRFIHVAAKNGIISFFFMDEYIHPLCMGKELTGSTANSGSISGWERSPGGGHGNPLQYSCLENPMDRGALQARP